MDNIPQVVKDKAKNLVEQYGDNIRFVGINGDNAVYSFMFPENERTGFPYIYVYNKKDNSVEEITGIRALEILASM